MIHIPEELKLIVQPLLAFVDATGAAVRGAQGGDGIDYAVVEGELADASAAIERAAHEAVLRAVDIDAKHITIGGRHYSRAGRYPGSYKTLAGEVIIERSIFRERGVRNGPTTDVISARTGAIGDGWLPRTSRAMSHLMAEGTSRDSEKSVREIGRLPYSRSSFESVSHLVAASTSSFSR